MGEQVKVTGIILSVKDVGDYDRRVVILTKERGKIIAFARGARKPGSPFMASCQPFAYGNYWIYEGRKSYIINQTEIKEYFSELKENLEMLFMASYFCEITEYFTQENVDGIEMMKLLYLSFKNLLKGKISPGLIRIIFEIKAFSLAGYMPETRCCCLCQKTNDIVGFYVPSGGVICRTCMIGKQEVYKMCQSTLYTIQHILYEPVEKLFHFTVSEDVYRELSQIVNAFRKKHIETEFNSISFLDVE